MYEMVSLLKEKDVARLIGMSLGSLRKWRLLKQGPHQGPPFLKIGTSVRYKPSDLTDWLDSQPLGGVNQSFNKSMARASWWKEICSIKSKSGASEEAFGMAMAERYAQYMKQLPFTSE